MKFSTIEKHIELMLYLYKHRNIELKRIEESLDIKYVTLRKIMATWNSQNLVEKKRKEVIILGGDKYEWSLTAKGIARLKKLYNSLNDTLKKDTITDLITVLESLNIQLTKKQKNQLYNKMRTL